MDLSWKCLEGKAVPSVQHRVCPKQCFFVHRLKARCITQCTAQRPKLIGLSLVCGMSGTQLLIFYLAGP